MQGFIYSGSACIWKEYRNIQQFVREYQDIFCNSLAKKQLHFEKNDKKIFLEYLHIFKYIYWWNISIHELNAHMRTLFDILDGIWNSFTNSTQFLHSLVHILFCRIRSNYQLTKSSVLGRKNIWKYYLNLLWWFSLKQI